MTWEQTACEPDPSQELIEVALPLEAIGAAPAKEKSSATAVRRPCVCGGRAVRWRRAGRCWMMSRLGPTTLVLHVRLTIVGDQATVRIRSTSAATARTATTTGQSPPPLFNVTNSVRSDRYPDHSNQDCIPDYSRHASLGVLSRARYSRPCVHPHEFRPYGPNWCRFRLNSCAEM